MPPPPVFRTALNYGAISGLAGFAFFLLLYFVGIFPLGYGSWLGFWIPIVVMVMATKNYRELNGGYINYWTAWGVGFLTAACGGFLFGLLVYIFGKIGVRDFLDQYKAINLEAMEKSRALAVDFMGEKMYEDAVENLDKLTLSNVAMQEFMNKSFGGMLFGLITAAILQKKQPDSSF
jgi:hypothetical protein